MTKQDKVDQDPQLSVASPMKLTATESSSLASIQARYANTLVQGSDYHAERALTFREQHRFVLSVGKLVLENHVEKVEAFDVSKIRSEGYKVCALGVTGLDVFAKKDKDQRKAMWNKVQPVTQALDALAHFHDKHEALSDAEFVVWWNEMGRLSGLYNKFKAAIKSERLPPAQDETAVEDAILGIIDNRSALLIDAVPNLSAGSVAVYVAQGAGDKTRMVRLDVDQDFIAGLAGKAPDPLQNASPDLLFWRQLLQVGAAIIPDGKSDVPIVPLKAGEKVDANTKMLPANTVYLTTDDGFSISGSRVNDSMVVEVLPYSDDIVSFIRANRFIDNRTRHTMEPRLRESRTAAGYKGDDIELSNKGVRFKHDDGTKLNGRLLLKPLTEMGTLWTHRVENFRTKAIVDLDDVGHASLNQFVAGLAKARDDLPVAIIWDEKGVSLRYGKAAPAVIGGESGTKLAVSVSKQDFKRGMTGLLALPLDDNLTISVDPRGLVQVLAVTELAVIKVYIQTLRDDGAKERKLLERVEKPEPEADLLAA